MLIINDMFSSIQETRDAINRYILNEGESYRVLKSDSRCYIVIYKDPIYKFKIRASLLKKKGVVIIILIPYSCSPANYYKNKQSSALWFLKNHHKASLVNNRTLTSAQIQATEHLWFSNTISYRQAYCLKEVLLNNIKGKEADCFVLFSVYIQRLEDSDLINQALLVTDKQDYFQAAAFALAAIKKACR